METRSESLTGPGAMEIRFNIFNNFLKGVGIDLKFPQD
jgi:hypothetical protein